MQGSLGKARPRVTSSLLQGAALLGSCSCYLLPPFPSDKEGLSPLLSFLASALDPVQDSAVM